MQLPKNMEAPLRQRALRNLREQAKGYAVPLDQYVTVNLQCTLPEAVEWELTRMVYGRELHPGAGVKFV